MGFMVNLSGFRGVFLKESLDNVKNAPTRLGVFVNLDFWKRLMMMILFLKI